MMDTSSEVLMRSTERVDGESVIISEVWRTTTSYVGAPFAIPRKRAADD